MKRRIEITIERERTTVLEERPRLLTEWCDACAASVQFAAIEHLAREAGLSLRTLFRAVEEGHVHFLEHGRDLLICLPSIRRPVRRSLMP